MNGSGLPSATQLQEWLLPFAPDLEGAIANALLVYLELLLRWNARTNLTAVRDPHEMILRHFGESLFAAARVPPAAESLLDVGSGAGFPGLVMALARPKLKVTLAESQGKKVAFLREAVRVLGVRADVWPRRVEEMPSTARFDVVTLRAVDRSTQALLVARNRLKAGGVLLHLTSGDDGEKGVIHIPGSLRRVVRVEEG